MAGWAAALPADARTREQLKLRAEEVCRAGGQADAIAFDMRRVELFHNHGDCTFETIVRRYDLTNPVLWRIAEIVHGADLDDDRYDAPEAPGLDTVLRGLSMIETDEQTFSVADALAAGMYEFYRRRLLLGRDPA